MLLKTTNDQMVPLYTTTLQHSKQWTKLSIKIGAFNKFSLIILVEFRDNSGTSSIAFDDIAFDKCASGKSALHSSTGL